MDPIDKRGGGYVPVKVSIPSPEEVESSLISLRALSASCGVPGLDLTQVAVPLEHLDLIPREIATRHGVLPVLVQDERILLAMAHPDDQRVIDELEFVTGKRVFPYVAIESALAKVIDQAYDLKLRGDVYYLGPLVPRDVLQRLGYSVPVPTVPPQPAQAGAQSPPPQNRPPATPMTLGKTKKHEPLGPPVPHPVVPQSLEALGPPSGFEEPTQDDLSSVSALPPAAALLAGGTSPVVLVVDDDDEIRKLLKRVLSDRGYRILEADRGTDALRLVKEHIPDLIILDATLPEIHGFDICRRIKGSQKYGAIPIIMISANYRGWRYAEDLRRNYGVSAYIEKPFRISEVLMAIAEAVAASAEEKPTVSRDEISAEAERNLRAGIAAYQAGDIDDAIAHLQRGSAIDPLAYRVHYHLGLLYGKKGEFYEAIQAMETAVEINDTHFSALKNLAVLYQKAGFKLKAVEMWERALSRADDAAIKKGIKDHLLTLL